MWPCNARQLVVAGAANVRVRLSGLPHRTGLRRTGEAVVIG